MITLRLISEEGDALDIVVDPRDVEPIREFLLSTVKIVTVEEVH